jgi:hypothetical protein
MHVADAYFRKQIEECRELAKRAARKEDRAFWEQAARRWQGILDQYRRPAAPRKSHNERSYTRHLAGHRKEAA